MGIKYYINENFFEKWSKKMAYVLGYLYADGSLEDATYLRGKYVRVISTDRDIIESIKKTMSAQHKIVTDRYNTANRKQIHLLQIGSHKLFDSLERRGLYPDKSLTMRFPSIPKKYLSNFIRGYLDGDGCVFFEKGKGASDQVIIKRLTIVFTSGSKLFLDKMSITLNNVFNLTNKKTYKSQRSYQLRYSTKDSIELFKKIYCDIKHNTYMKRKADIFYEYFKLNQSRLDNKIINTLRCLNYPDI